MDWSVAERMFGKCPHFPSIFRASSPQAIDCPGRVDFDACRDGLSAATLSRREMGSISRTSVRFAALGRSMRIIGLKFGGSVTAKKGGRTAASTGQVPESERAKS
jgi:hypothetical protein